MRLPERVTMCEVGTREKGAVRAIEAGVDAIHTVLSASESHNLANVNMTIAESLDRLGAVLRVAAAAKLHVGCGISTSFGCPFEPGASGNVCTEDLAHCLHAMGVQTGIDLDRLLGVSRRVQAIVGRALPGQIVKAGPSTRKYPVPDTVAGRLAAKGAA